MTVDNPEFNPNSNETINAYPSVDEVRAQSVGIIKDLFLTVGVPEVMGDGLITQEEGKSLFKRFVTFAQEYENKTGKAFDVNAIALMAGYVGVEGEEKIMQELGIKTPREQLRIEMEDGRILSITEANEEMRQNLRNLKEDIKKDSKNQRAELAKDIKKNPKGKKQLANKKDVKSIPDKIDIDLTEKNGKSFGVEANKIELAKGEDKISNTEGRKNMKTTKNPGNQN